MGKEFITFDAYPLTIASHYYGKLFYLDGKVTRSNVKGVLEDFTRMWVYVISTFEIKLDKVGENYTYKSVNNPLIAAIIKYTDLNREDLNLCSSAYVKAISSSYDSAESVKEIKEAIATILRVMQQICVFLDKAGHGDYTWAAKPSYLKYDESMEKLKFVKMGTVLSHIVQSTPISVSKENENPVEQESLIPPEPNNSDKVLGDTGAMNFDVSWMNIGSVKTLLQFERMGIVTKENVNSLLETCCDLDRINPKNVGSLEEEDAARVRPFLEKNKPISSSKVETSTPTKKMNLFGKS
jgi:hypothetical protein